jgi:prepilin peptidase CpaA
METQAVAQAASIPVLVILVAVLIAAVTDVWKFKVYNVLTLPLLLSGLLYHGVVGGMTGLLHSSLGVLFAFSLLIAFYLIGGMGAGDIKLVAAVGAWLGLPLTLYVLCVSSLAAWLYGVVLILLRGGVREMWVNLQILWHRFIIVGRHLAADDQVEALVDCVDRRRRLIPFAAMVALGMIATLGWTLLGRPS